MRFRRDDPPLGRGIDLQIEVVDARSTLVALGVIASRPFREVKESWYAVSEVAEAGQREFFAQDPDGCRIRVAQPLGSRERARPER